jgi:hypothetical protein
MHYRLFQNKSVDYFWFIMSFFSIFFYMFLSFILYNFSVRTQKYFLWKLKKKVLPTKSCILMAVGFFFSAALPSKNCQGLHFRFIFFTTISARISEFDQFWMLVYETSRNVNHVNHLKLALKNSWAPIQWIYFWRVSAIWNHCES